MTTANFHFLVCPIHQNYEGCREVVFKYFFRNLAFYCCVAKGRFSKCLNLFFCICSLGFNCIIWTSLLRNSSQNYDNLQPQVNLHILLLMHCVESAPSYEERTSEQARNTFGTHHVILLGE